MGRFTLFGVLMVDVLLGIVNKVLKVGSAHQLFTYDTYDFEVLVNLANNTSTVSLLEVWGGQCSYVMQVHEF